MKLYNQLKLRFDTPMWGLHPELALFDILLDKNPYFVTLVSDDVLSEVKESSFGCKVYRNAYKYQIEGEKVANSDKVFSVFETHTDILVKGQREVEFGHKVLISRGSSCMILDHKVFEGNPNDKNLLIPSMERIKTYYDRTPESSSADGGFCRGGKP